MACDITSGRKVPCKKSLGGASQVLFINTVENPFTVVNGVATAINPLITEVFAYDLVGEGNSLAQSMVSDKTPGTTVNTITLTLALQKMSKEDHYQLDQLSYGFPIAVVKDKNGLYHACGISDGLDFTVVATTGTASADFNGYNLTGVAMEGQLAPILSDTVVTALIALIVEDTPSV